jgi:hypothetical protein
MSERCLPVVAPARSAIPAGPVRRLGYLRRVGHHVKFEFNVADPTGKSLPVCPVREGHRLC